MRGESGGKEKKRGKRGDEKDGNEEEGERKEGEEGMNQRWEKRKLEVKIKIEEGEV